MFGEHSEPPKRENAIDTRAGVRKRLRGRIGSGLCYCSGQSLARGQSQREIGAMNDDDMRWCDDCGADTTNVLYCDACLNDRKAEAAWNLQHPDD